MDFERFRGCSVNCALKFNVLRFVLHTEHMAGPAHGLHVGVARPSLKLLDSAIPCGLLSWDTNVGYNLQRGYLDRNGNLDAECNAHSKPSVQLLRGQRRLSCVACVTLFTKAPNQVIQIESECAGVCWSNPGQHDVRICGVYVELGTQRVTVVDACSGSAPTCHPSTCLVHPLAIIVVGLMAPSEYNCN